MTAAIIDGKAFAGEIRERVASQVARLKEMDIVPGLAVVLVGDDPASEIYVRNKNRQTEEAGMASFEHRLGEDTEEQELVELVRRLNADPQVHGILVQLPLPDHIDENLVINAIDPAKDVDGFHVINAGRLATGQSAMVPCTPLGCLLMLRDRLGDLSGREAVVIGRSNIVGKPMAQLLLRENCTVTVCHSRTRDIADVVRRGEIVVAAVGRRDFVPAEWIRRGATVIDVGINRIDAPEKGEGKTRLVGDVQFDAVKDVADAITPVPGGVGPMTIACLLANTVTACCLSHGLPAPQDLTV
ncbi:bifunctional methylenetetrahydrofolate dehydrogenase/methenyltetrahydrofolate cyclohydrolase FolD [Tranquillimonas rosea]|uniref:bifunctional methylenetetrahydrofolate dehydrogenase/methenyltetrahydrofolate cyclohydrolase FolD n=1 Tax=Tranquillimonas rosea TaxID=641238 RepID=UPI003BABC052